MDNPIIIVCDNKGNPTGEYVARETGHTGQGRHHLAITILLINSSGQVLLQKRKHKRFDRFWDLTGATDLYRTEDRNETFERAALRCLRKEWGIREIGEIREIGVFNYFAKDREFCENEHCAMMTGEYNGEINMDPKAGYEYKWMDKAKFLADLESNPKKYTPWAIEGVKILKTAGFFGSSLTIRSLA